MAKTSSELEQEFIQGLKTSTGKDVSHWLRVLGDTGLTKNNELIKYMKINHGWRHMDSAFLAGMVRNGGKPVYASDNSLLENQLSKYEQWRPLFTEISKRLLTAIPGSEMIAKKTYVSFARKREYAAVNIKSKEIRIGMDLGDHPIASGFADAKLTGPMPRISKMSVLTSMDDWTHALDKAIRISDARVNG